MFINSNFLIPMAAYSTVQSTRCEFNVGRLTAFLVTVVFLNTPCGLAFAWFRTCGEYA